jgi:O-antigen/teichoic acid export membrane protein
MSWLFPPALLGAGVYLLMRQLRLRAGDYRSIAHATWLRALIANVMRIGLGLFGFGVEALVVSETAAPWLTLVILRQSWLGQLMAYRYPFTREEFGVVMRRNQRFPLLETPSALVDQLALMLPITAIAMLFGPAQAGLFGLAYRLVALPNAQIGSAIGDVFFAQMATYVRTGDLTAAARLYWRMAAQLALVSVGLTVAAIVLAPSLVPLILGEPWRPAGRYAAIIAPWVYAGLAVAPLSSALSVLKRQDLKILYNVVNMSLLLVVFVVARRCSLDPGSAITVLTAGQVASYIFYFMLIATAVQQARRRYWARDECQS